MPDEAQRRRRLTFMLAGEESGDADLSELEAGLSIDPSRLTRALADQAAAHYRVGLRAARLEADALVAEAEVLSRTASIEDYLRGRADESREQVSEASIAARARRHADVEKAVRAAALVGRRLLVIRALDSAYAERMRALEALASAVSQK